MGACASASPACCSRGLFDGLLSRAVVLTTSLSKTHTFNPRLPLLAGPCSFSLPAFRSAGLPAAATAHVTAEWGATLRGEGAYALPPGAAAAAAAAMGDPQAAAEGGGDEGGGDGAAMPAWPKFEGLTFASSDAALPVSVEDVPFPPPAAVAAR